LFFFVFANLNFGDAFSFFKVEHCVQVSSFFGFFWKKKILPLFLFFLRGDVCQDMPVMTPHIPKVCAWHLLTLNLLRLNWP
jgi:hypothetical protein